MGYNEVTVRLEELGITHISDDLGAKINGTNLELYADLQNCTPRLVTIIPEHEVWAIVNYWLDGYCICGEAIPQHHAICRQCSREESEKWFGT